VSAAGGLRATARGALAEAWANRASFWTQVVAMAVNDLVWVLFWVLFFRGVGEVRGWDTSSVLVLQAALTTAGGIVLGFFSNARSIGRLATEGGLDAALALPVRPLAHLLVRRVDAVNVGDVVFGVLLFAVACEPTPTRLAVYVGTSLVASLLLGGFLVTTGSLAFFTGRPEAGDYGLHSMLLLAAYPADVFSGAPKLLLYTAIPAAFVASVPARLIDDPDPALALGLGAAAVVCAFVGWATFTLGLRRYTSGSTWTRA
jgi:ABC-2 type transport system permease protein